MMSWIRTASSRARRTVGMGTGGAGGIDTALAVVAEDFGAEVANEVARSLDLCQRGAGSQSQFASPVWDPGRSVTLFDRRRRPSRLIPVPNTRSPSWLAALP